jgi:hypothetical protein
MVTGGATDDDKHVLAHKLIMLVSYEVLFNMENERSSSVESSRLERGQI